VLELIKYFDFFHHPVTLHELFKYASDGITLQSIKNALQVLLAQNIIEQKNDFFYLSTANTNAVAARIAGEALAARLLPRAKRVGKFIALFPFVRFVGISGSLSKHYADKKTDYDFFIITANNTLWISRTILHLVKKLSFLLGKQHALCMNYFLDEHHLRLAENNIFVRIELSTLIPVYNINLYRTFLLRNQHILPNIQHLQVDFTGAMQYDLLKHNQQHLGWRPLNRLLMKWTDLKWRRKWAKRGYPMEDYDIAMKTTPYVSKNHPKNFQKQLLENLQKLMS
jgi:hypothetical protein